MIKRSFIVSLLLALVAIPLSSPAQMTAVTNGLNWLESTQTIDGNWLGVATEEFVATATATDALFLLNPASSDYSQGLQWLEGRPESPTDLLARRIIALSRAGHTTTSEVAQLIALRDTSGSWGGASNYRNNILDTALALQALKAVNSSDSTVINPALAYLTAAQNSDGGWGFVQGDASNVFTTAMVSATLQQFPQQAIIATAVNRATGYLFDQQKGDGGFGGTFSTVYETALTYAALVVMTTDATVLNSAVNYLTAAQASNGSWNDDPYATALALKALHLSANRPAPLPPPPAGGTISGTLVDAVTNQRLAGVAVVLASDPLSNANTDAAGNFSLREITPGRQQVDFTLAGYKSASVTAAVVVDETVNLGNIPLVSSYSTGTIAGRITNSAGNPLTGVTIAVNGAWGGSAVTSVDGTFAFDYVTPGEVTISATKAGYQSASGTGLVYARTTLTFSPRLSTTLSQVATGTLIGRVVSNTFGSDMPIDHLPGEEGVTVKVSGGIVVEPDPNNGGYFTIPNLAPNTYQVTIGMNGFNSHTFRIVVTEGCIIDLGTIRLEMGFAMTLTGLVTDVATGKPISGAEVLVLPSNLTARTDFAGRYVIADINDAESTLKAVATGYTEKAYIVGRSPWTQTIDFALSPKANTGRLVGTVIDASSSQPLSGVTLTLATDPSVSTVTDSAGGFTFYALPKDTQQIKITLAGYAARLLTTTVTAGVVNNVGEIALAVTPLAATVQGLVWDGVANTPFADVTMLVTGSDNWQSATNLDGRYRMDGVNPGTITVAATAESKPEYFGASFTGTLAPGGILIFNPVLSTTPPPGILKGTITDFLDHYPIQGAVIILSPQPAGVAPVTTDAAGAFILSNIPAGTYTAAITASGYFSKNVSIEIKPGYLGDTTISVLLQRPGSFTAVAGKVLDSTTGNPIANAKVTVVGTELVTTSEADGSYMLSGILSFAFNLRVEAEGYDSFVYGAKTTAYGNYLRDLPLFPSGMSTTRVFGTVTDVLTNESIMGAEVKILGTDNSVVSDGAGKYTIEGLTDLSMEVKASAPGYDSNVQTLSVDAFGAYEITFELSKSRASTVAIKSIVTDKPAYPAFEPVTAVVELENTGDVAAEMNVEAQVVDEFGNVIGLVIFGGNPLLLEPHVSETVALAWSTEQNAPGIYSFTVGLVDRVQGGMLAESSVPFVIDQTANVEGLVAMIEPKFVNIRTTQTIGILAYMVNRSNTEAALTAQYEITNPDGTMLSQGELAFTVAGADPFKEMPLADITHTFVSSGQYPVTVKVFSGSTLLAQTTDAIYVAPAIRIAPTQTLVPTSVIPDGDKEIRINIQIEGVEDLQ